MKKKILYILAAACVMSSQTAFAISHVEITDVNPNNNRASYLGEGNFLSEEKSDDGEYKNNGNTTIHNAVAFSKIKTVAVAPMLYSPSDKEPAWKDVMASIDSNVNAMNLENNDVRFISYDEVADNILRFYGKDITTMNRRQASKVFKEYVSEYANGYAEITIANGSKGTSMFLDVISVETNETVYTYKTGLSATRDINSYANAAKGGLKSINNARKEAIKQAAKAETGISWDLNK